MIEIFEIFAYLLIVIVSFITIIFVLFKISKISKNKYVRVLTQVLLFSIIVLVLLELIYRVSLGIYHREYRFVTYPLKIETYTYLRLMWPEKAAKENEISTTIEYQGLHYFNATQINDFKVQDKRNSSLNKKNIVTLGGSSTWGHNNDDKTYPYFLKTNLKDFNVYNYGQRGHRSSNFVNNMEKSGLFKKKIDYAVLYVGHNDSMSLQYIFKAYDVVQTNFKRITKYIPVEYSMIVRDLSVFLYGRYASEQINSILNKEIDYPTKVIDDNNEYFTKYIKELIDILTINNKNIHIIFIQELTNYYKPINELTLEKSNIMKTYQVINNDFKGKFRIMKKLSKENNNIDFYMSNEILENNKISDIMLDVVHLKDYGNKVLADFVAEKIISIDNK
mgnify:FL=1